MIQYKDVWPGRPVIPFVDTWLDARVRGNLDRAANWVQNGAIGEFGPTSSQGMPGVQAGHDGDETGGMSSGSVDAG